MLDRTLIHLYGLYPLTRLQELKEILVDPLPVGCTLLVGSSLVLRPFSYPHSVVQAILDTCHSGTLLDLPHYHCNSVYVPWQSKGERRTMTMQNINGWSTHHSSLSYTNICLVRRQATYRLSDPAPPTQTFETAMEGQSPVGSLLGSLQLDTQLSEARPASKRELSPRGRPRGRREVREQMLFGSMTRFASPEARFVCNGWCKHSDEPHPNVVSIERTLLSDSRVHVCRQLSLSACSDLQRAWEGPKGSLTTVLCNYLSKCILCNATVSRSDRSHQRSTVAHHMVP